MRGDIAVAGSFQYTRRGPRQRGNMILTTHAIVGAAVASFLPSHPAFAGLAAFGSHFAIDAIPHRDYSLHSFSLYPDLPKVAGPHALLRDAVWVGLDALVGILLAMGLWSSEKTAPVILLGAIAGILPDPLQVVYSIFPYEPLRTLQRFHCWSHTNRRLDDRIVSSVLSQAAFALAVIAVAMFLHSSMFGLVAPSDRLG